MTRFGTFSPEPQQVLNFGSGASEVLPEFLLNAHLLDNDDAIGTLRYGAAICSHTTMMPSYLSPPKSSQKKLGASRMGYSLLRVPHVQHLLCRMALAMITYQII